MSKAAPVKAGMSYVRYLTTPVFIVPLAGLLSRLPESGLNSLFF